MARNDGPVPAMAGSGRTGIADGSAPSAVHGGIGVGVHGAADRGQISEIRCRVNLCTSIFAGDNFADSGILCENAFYRKQDSYNNQAVSIS